SEPSPGGPPADRADGAGPFLRLALVVAAVVVVAAVTHHVDLLIVVAALAAMIMLHEGGHFATAKWGHMKVTEYFLGFGPRVWSFRRGETEYGIKAIPAGGYVKIVGMSNLEKVPEQDEPRTYRQAPFRRRLSVAVAGSVVHYILAFLLLWAVFAFLPVFNTHQVAVAHLDPFAHRESPAQLAGFKSGDVFVSVDGQQVSSVNGVANIIEAHPGQGLTVVVDRHGHPVTLHVTPVSASSVQLQGGAAAGSSLPAGADGIIGVALANPEVRYNPATAVALGAQQTWHLTTATVNGVVGIFSPTGIHSFVGQIVGSPPSGSQPATASPGGSGAGSGSAPSPSTSNRLISIFGAARIATQAAHAGIAPLLVLLADINVAIGLFNMFPMLPLDGGHVVIALYERLRSRRGRRHHADVAKLLPAVYAVFFLLIVIGVSTLYLDIVHPIPNPFH
ncbi:MAG: M50 family metallopeptidase, partial [Acidimicrobiales bacterium]